MARLSIVIPHLGPAESLERTLVSVLEQGHPDNQIIVAHRGDYDDPYDLGRTEVEFVACDAHASAVDLMNEGLARARGEWLQTLLPGAVVEDSWMVSMKQVLSHASCEAVAPWLVATDLSASHSWSGLDAQPLPRRQFVRGSSRRDACVPTWCGGIYRTATLQAIGGWMNGLSREAAEAELGLLFRRLGWSAVSTDKLRVLAERTTLEGRVGGYQQGQVAGQLACAYAELGGEDQQLASMIARLGHLIGGLAQPSSIAERLGWCLGVADRSLVATVRWRWEQADRGRLALESGKRSLRRAA